MTAYEIVAIDGEGCVHDANGQNLFWFRREDAQRAIDGFKREAKT